VSVIIEKKSLHIIDCGLSEYRKILDLQIQLQEQRQNNKISDTVLIVEHPSVITLGARREANRLLLSESLITARGIEIVRTRRGGGVTAHNPGQLVFYPIIHLRNFGLGVSEYIRKLEDVGIKMLRLLNVSSERKKGLPGLWFKEKKIASIGVKVSRSVTCHGMAININNDLSIFDLFVPCGIDGVQITSVQKETGKQYLMTDVKKQLCKLLTKHFSNESSFEFKTCS
jgi:lipoyl(octanoyl) transferase